MKKILKIEILWLLLSCTGYTGYAQQDSCCAINSLKIGTELDVLPYATGGYYASFWVGKGHIRIRPVVSQVSIPSFYVKNGFTDNRLNAYAFLADYFINDNFKGLWFGTGLEYWDSSIKREVDLMKKNYGNMQFTLGTGYILPLYKGIYLNPWGAFHLCLGGDKTVSFPSVGTAYPTEYSTKFITLEASVKIGVRF